MAELGLGESWAYGIGWACAEWKEERSEGWAGLEGKRIFLFFSFNFNQSLFKPIFKNSLK